MAHTVKCNALSVYIYNFCLENSSPTPTMHTTYLQSANFAVLGQVGKNKTRYTEHAQSDYTLCWRSIKSHNSLKKIEPKLQLGNTHTNLIRLYFIIKC